MSGIKKVFLLGKFYIFCPAGTVALGERPIQISSGSKKIYSVVKPLFTNR
jgi:hypothetical protein